MHNHVPYRWMHHACQVHVSEVDVFVGVHKCSLKYFNNLYSSLMPDHNLGPIHHWPIVFSIDQRRRECLFCAQSKLCDVVYSAELCYLHTRWRWRVGRKGFEREAHADEEELCYEANAMNSIQCE